MVRFRQSVKFRRPVRFLDALGHLILLGRDAPNLHCFCYALSAVGGCKTWWGFGRVHHHSHSDHSYLCGVSTLLGFLFPPFPFLCPVGSGRRFGRVGPPPPPPGAGGALSREELVMPYASSYFYTIFRAVLAKPVSEPW